MPAPAIIATWPFGQTAVRIGAPLLRQGRPALDAALAGAQAVEDDPRVNSVGYGGLPNAIGTVQLDACVMDGRTLSCGGVAGLENVRHAAAVAREKWLHAIGPDADAESGMLFDLNTVDDQIASEKKRAERIVAENLRELVADGRDKAVVQHAQEIFGKAYGEARETTFSAVLRQLVKDGEIEYVTKGAKPHKHVIRRGPALQSSQA